MGALAWIVVGLGAAGASVGASARERDGAQAAEQSPQTMSRGPASTVAEAMGIASPEAPTDDPADPDASSPLAPSSVLPDEPSVRAGRDEEESTWSLRRALAEMPDTDPDKPAMLLRLAYAHRRDGEDAHMQGVCLRIIREYPTDPTVPTVYASLGDSFYDTGQYEYAGKVYRKVAKYTASPVAGLGEYMHAWVLLRQEPRDAAEAVQKFMSAASRATQGVAAPTDGFDPQSLREAALNDLVLAYFHAGKPSLFVTFFEKLLNERDSSALLHLATNTLGLAYEDTGQGEASVALCTAYNARFPDRVCKWRVTAG